MIKLKPGVRYLLANGFVTRPMELAGPLFSSVVTVRNGPTHFLNRRMYWNRDGLQCGEGNPLYECMSEITNPIGKRRERRIRVLGFPLDKVVLMLITEVELLKKELEDVRGCGTGGSAKETKNATEDQATATRHLATGRETDRAKSDD